MGCGLSRPGPAKLNPVLLEPTLRLSSQYIFGLEEKFDSKTGKSSFLSKILEFDSNALTIKNKEVPSDLHVSVGTACLTTSPNEIYITGGYNLGSHQYGGKCYLYNPTSNTVKEIPSLQIPRAYHCGTYYSDSLYVFGGKRKAIKGDPTLSKETEAPQDSAGDFMTSTCETYNLKEGKWELIPSMKKARAFAYCCISNEHIYLFGGLNQTKEKTRRIHTIERYSIQSKSWSVHSFKLAYGIVASSVIQSPNQDSLIILGGNYEGKVHWNLELDIENGYLISREPLRFARSNCVAGINGKTLYALGGDDLNSAEHSDAAKLQWEVKANVISRQVLSGDLDHNFSVAAAPLMVNKKPTSHLAQIGIGKTSYEDTCIVLGDPNNPFILQVDLKSEEIISKSIPAPLVLYNNQPGIKLKDVSPPQYFLAGGILNTNVPVNKAFIYEPFANKAKRLPNLKTKRELSSIVQKDKFIYVIGGRNFGEHGEEVLASVEKYDLTANKWDSVANLNIKRHSSIAFVANNAIYVAGGSAGKPYQYQEKASPNEIVQVIEKYNEAKNQWEILDIKLQTYITNGLSLQVNNNEVLVIGGLYYDEKGEKKHSNEIRQYSIKAEGGDSITETKVSTVGQARKNMMGFKFSKGFLLLAGGEGGYCEIFDSTWKPTAKALCEKLFSQVEKLNKGNENDYQLVL